MLFDRRTIGSSDRVGAETSGAGSKQRGGESGGGGRTNAELLWQSRSYGLVSSEDEDDIMAEAGGPGRKSSLKTKEKVTRL